jgi:hypothetical protein
MTLLDMITAVVGGEGHPDVELIRSADREAATFCAQGVGVLYEDGSTGPVRTHVAIKALARAHRKDFEAARAALLDAGWIEGPGGEKHAVSDLATGYTWPLVEAAYYLGVALGWRLASTMHGDA